MSEKSAFAARLDEAASLAGASNRTKFAEDLGVEENAKQVAQRWIDRMKVPEKYRMAMLRRGVSIDYVNEGKGSVRATDWSSQPTGPDRDMIRDAVKVARLVRDNSLEPVPEDVFVEVLTIAIMRVSEHTGAIDLPEMAREVAAAFRSRGHGDGNKR